MKFVRGIRNVRASVFPKPSRAFTSTATTKEPVNHGSELQNESKPQTKGICSDMMSKFHDYAQEHSVCYKAASSFISKRGVHSFVCTDYLQTYFIKWTGFIKQGSTVYVDEKTQLVICGFKRSLFGFGKEAVPFVRKFQVPIADYRNAVIDAKYHEDKQGIIVDITSFKKPSYVLVEVK